MNIQNKLTIVLGAYQRSHLIKNTIYGIINQTYKDFVLIIVDDNHPEDLEEIEKTLAIIHSFQDDRISYIKNKFNIGVPFVYKKWIDLVKSDYFMIVAEGDVLKPDALEKMVTFLDQNPRASFVHGLEIFHFKDKESQYITPLFEDTGCKPAKMYLESHLTGGKYGWSQASAMFRTEFFRIKNIPVVADHYWDFYFHCTYLLFSEKIGYLNEYLTDRRVDTSYQINSANEYFRDSLERLYLGLKFIDQFEFILIKKGFNPGKYRYKISGTLFKRAFRTGKYIQFNYSLGLALSTFRKLFLRDFATLIFFPFKLIFSILLKTYHTVKR